MPSAGHESRLSFWANGQAHSVSPRGQIARWSSLLQRCGTDQNPAPAVLLLGWPGICMSEITWAGRPSPSELGISSDLAAVVSPAAVISLAGAYGRLRQSPIVGTVLHLAPSGAPPFGQNTDTSVSVSSQLTAPPSCTYRRPA